MFLLSLTATQNEVIVTGGEDGKINAWPQQNDGAMEVDAAPSRKRDKRDMDWEDEHVGHPRKQLEQH
jgi:hypothetical protein